MKTSSAAARPDDLDPYPDFFVTDLNRLVEEVAGHSEMFHHYALKAAAAAEVHERAKASLKVVRAEASLEIRLHPHRFGFEKVTEAMVAELVEKQKSVRRAEDRRIAAKHDLDVAEVAVETLRHKKSMLERGTQLAGADFFSPPKVSGPVGETVRARERDRAFGERKKRGSP